MLLVYGAGQTPVSKSRPNGVSPMTNDTGSAATEEQFGFDEGFAVARPQRASLSGTAVLTSVALAERYAFPGRNEPVVTASSVYTDDPQDAASSAFDGSPQTTWISGAGDARPALTIRWRGRKRISMIMIERPAGVTGPLAVRITGSAGQVRTGVVGSQGLFSPDSVTFAPMKTRSRSSDTPFSLNGILSSPGKR